MAKVISLINQKGGVGKSTSTVELAACFQASGKKVLVIDFDQQCNLSKTFKFMNESNIYKIFKAESQDELIERIKAGIIKTDYFDAISSDERLSKLDQDFTSSNDVYLLADVCETLESIDDYDYIFIDNNPDRKLAMEMAFVASDYVVVPFDGDVFSIDSVSVVANDLKKLTSGRHQISKAEIIGFICTQYENTNVYKTAYEAVQQFQERNFPNAFIEKVRKGTVVKEAHLFNKPVQSYDKNSKPAIDYRNIAEHIMKLA